jgi:hypothetical protein
MVVGVADVLYSVQGLESRNGRHRATHQVRLRRNPVI